MSFFWVVIIFIILIAIAIDPRSWGEWAGDAWHDLYTATYQRRTDDIQVRAFYRKVACEYVPNIEASEFILFPDTTLDSLLNENRFDEANIYRMIQLKEARERRDREAVDNYSAYGKLISAREADYEEHKRRTLRETFPTIAEKLKRIPAAPRYDPMALPEQKSKGPRRERIRSGFLEIPWKNMPQSRKDLPPEPVAEKIESVQPGPPEPAKVAPILPAPVIEPHHDDAEPKKTTDDVGEDYTELISI